MTDSTVAVSLVRRVAFDKPYRMPLPRIQTDLVRGRSTTDLTPRTHTASPLSTSSTNTSCSSLSPQTPVDSVLSVVNDGSPTLKDRRPRFMDRVARSAPPILSMFRLLTVDPDTIYDPHEALWVPEKPKPLPAIPSEAQGLRTAPTPDPDAKDIYGVSDLRTLHTDVSVGFPKRPRGPTVHPHSHPSLEVIRGLPDGLYKGHIPLQKGWFPSVHWKGLEIEVFSHHTHQ